MRNNKAILDEAARSVRRTFIGSVAGTLGMLAVVGAAGAYGMPERLTARAFTAALSSLNLSPRVDHAAATPEAVVKIAENAPRGAMPMPGPVVPEKEPVQKMPELPAASAPVPVPPKAPAATPAAAPHETSIASPTPDTIAVKAVADVAETKPAPALVAVKAEAKPVEPAQVQTESIEPRAIPESVAQPMLPAPLVFEAPKPDLIPPLAALAKTEPVKAPAAPVQSKPAAAVVASIPVTPAQAPAAQSDKPAEAAIMELPKTVSVLPPPKPPLTPAQRLDLQGKDYDKAERCLAQAVYFEARDQAVRGQQAVAQVVLNRVFSPYYPKDICSVVYQNAHHHLACQFTFACDGKPETIRERGAWARANRIAKQSLEAKVWLPEVDKATHYHASYVHPRWVREMKVMVRYGIHTFYRPRNWGDGSNEPHWGTVANSVKPAVLKPAAQTVSASKPHHGHAAPPPKRMARIALRRI